MEEQERKLFIWVPYPNQIAGLYDDLNLLRENCREHSIPIRNIAVSLVDTETKGAWMDGDGDFLFECHLTGDQSPINAPSELIWDWTQYARGDANEGGRWEESFSGTFWQYPNIEALANDMTVEGAYKVPYELAELVHSEARGEPRA